MNKSELIEEFAKASNIKIKESEDVIETIFGSMLESLRKSQRVEIRGFGSFVVKEYKQYLGRNPKTGEKLSVPPKKRPFFKVGKELRERING